MRLVKFLNDMFKKDGFILIDHNSKRYQIGKPFKDEPIEIYLLDKNLNSKLYLNPDLYFGEAYMNGSLRIKNGTLSEFLEIAFKNIGRDSINAYGKIFNKIKGTFKYITNLNKITKSKQNVAHHYDLSDELYDLFLDKKKQYSCAYFKNESDTLEVAQQNKIDHIIKKLNIEPNQKVLDIGSGWGTLAIEIAKKTQASVTGITLSQNQLEFSKKKASELNLNNQVEFKLMDYRQLNEKFDRIVSVGMFEHVGKKLYSTYFNSVSKMLNNNGVALIHTIGSINPPRSSQPWITKYIFPGGYTPSLSDIVSPIEHSGLIPTDIEILRMHYAHTLKNWKKRFLSKKDKVLEMFDEKFLRMWEFYLASCEMAFKWGDLVVFQLQLTKDIKSVPNTRDYIY